MQNPLMNHEPEKSTTWRETITLLLALGATFYQISIQTITWFISIPIALTFVSLILLVKEIGLYGQVVAWYKGKKKVSLLNRVITKRYPEFVAHIEQFEVFSELMSTMQNVEWLDSECIKYRYVFASGSVFANWFNSILYNAKKFKNFSKEEMTLIGERLRDFVSVFDEYYLKIYSDALREGRAKYPSEQFMKNIKNRKNKYDHAISSYNDFCAAIERETQTSILTRLYNTSIDLDYISALKSTEK